MCPVGSYLHQSPRFAAPGKLGQRSQGISDYRLITSMAYRYQAVYIKFIGTHAEYDALDAETVELEL
mgnify:CR=1 FL=1